ncbi:unnamed protein product [Prorocentrum cordatum]|uniref:Uncharacterized protein n=1 Tax=Prorocentrum cordatum TaxID=2364126 RepID=A0ABN9QNS1_9DINO|nr:unnamed protein product [Polarella glacialis]
MASVADGVDALHGIVDEALRSEDGLVGERAATAKLGSARAGEMLAEIREEEKHVEEDVAEGIADEVVLRGFWETFDDYEREFSGSVRDNFRKGHSVYEELQTLWGKIQGPNPPSEEEVGAALEKIDLASVGAPLGEGRILPVNDIVEELVMVPRIPYKELAQLEMEWKTGKSDSVTVLSKLQQMHTAGKVPSGWLNQGAVRQEDYDEMEHDTGGRPP